MRPILNSTNPFLEPSDDDKTNIFVLGLDGVPEEPVIYEENF